MWVVTKNLYSYKTSQPVIHHLCSVVRFFLLLSSSSPHCIIYNCLTCPMMPHAFQNSSVFLRTLKVKPILFCDVPIIRERQNGPLLIHQNSKVQTIKHGVSLQIGFVYICVLWIYDTGWMRHRHHNNFSLWPNNQMCNSHYILSSLKETRPVIYDLSCFNQIIILIYS